jgi:tRNA 2-thiouridine synthesizing protein A
MQADKQLKAAGMACINLTPEIKKALSDMNSAQVLEVFSDDSAAREGIPAWCRLTGHSLLEAKVISPEETLFLIRKK